MQLWCTSGTTKEWKRGNSCWYLFHVLITSQAFCPCQWSPQEFIESIIFTKFHVTPELGQKRPKQLFGNNIFNYCVKKLKKCYLLQFTICHFLSIHLNVALIKNKCKYSPLYIYYYICTFKNVIGVKIYLARVLSVSRCLILDYYSWLSLVAVVVIYNIIFVIFFWHTYSASHQKTVWFIYVKYYWK